VATLSLLTGTIGATALDRDHSNAHAWLQTASDMLYAREPVHCDEMSRDDIIAAYQQTIQETENPEHWPQGNIRITDLRFWHYGRDTATNGVEEGWFIDRCTTKLQRITLQVRDEGGKIIENVEVIIGGD
jgi:hypothetical protein